MRLMGNQDRNMCVRMEWKTEREREREEKLIIYQIKTIDIVC